MIETTAYPKVVLVKFQFTNPRLIPFGIKKVERNDEQSEENTEAEIKSGEHTEAENINVKPFIVQLFKSGYCLSDIHYYIKKVGEYKKKYILVLSFNKNYPLVRFSKKIISQISQLTDKDIWGFCHFWRNPNDLWAVECLHRIPPDQIGKDINIGELFFQEPENNQEKYVHESI